MNPLSIWWRTHRLERTVLIGFVVLVVLVGVNVWRLQSLAGSKSEQSSRAARPTPAPTRSAAPTPAPTPDPVAVAQAQQVAAAFLVAWATYRWDDTLQTQVARLQPYTTARFVQASRVSPAMAEQRQATHEMASAQAQSVELYGKSASGQLGFDAQALQTVTSDRGTTTRGVTVQLNLQQTAQGWRVSSLD